MRAGFDPTSDIRGPLGRASRAARTSPVLYGRAVMFGNALNIAGVAAPLPIRLLGARHLEPHTTGEAGRNSPSHAERFADREAEAALGAAIEPLRDRDAGR